MTPRDFANLCDLLRRRSGLALTSDKKALVGHRLAPVARRFGFRDVAALLAEFPYPPEELARAVTEAMTTNETSFFRERAVFDFLSRSALPALIRARAASQRLRVWCAAVSTGQEAYSLATVLDEAALAARGWKIDIIATDLSEGAIARAREGLYAQHEVDRGLPDEMLARHFAADGAQWRVADRLRHMVTFRAFNLLDHFGWLGEIDIVLCRNVLLYFEPGLKSEIQAKLEGVLADDGYLFLGESESADDPFAATDGPRGLYVKHGGPRRLAI